MRKNIIKPTVSIDEIKKYSFVAGYDGAMANIDNNVREEVLDYSLFLYYIDQCFLGESEKNKSQTTKSLLKMPVSKRKEDIQGRIAQMITNIADTYITTNNLENKTIVVEKNSSLGRISPALSNRVLNFMLKLNGYEMEDGYSIAGCKANSILKIKRSSRIEQKRLSGYMKSLKLPTSSHNVDYFIGNSNNEEMS